MKNPLIEKFGDDKRWVNYRIETAKGKKTKIPYSVNGRKASSTDPETWSTYAEAKAKSENVGIVFRPEQDILGIDIDHCLKDNEIVHEQKENIQKLIEEAATYTEVSPSGEGLHLYFSLTEGFSLDANKHAPYECYTSGRYFTVTENNFSTSSDIWGDSDKTPQQVRTIDKSEALRLLEIIGYPWEKEEEEKPTPKTESFQSSVNLSDDAIISKMFKSKNGDKVKSLWDGNGGDDQSANDMALCSHLAFWTRKDAGQMERLWLSSPLGMRKKTQSREDYRTRTINSAIKNCKTVYETPAMKVEMENPDLDLLFIMNEKKDKVFVQNTENMCRILRRHPDFINTLHYDAFKNIFEIKDGGKWRALDDSDIINIQTAISIIFTCFSKVGKEMIFDAVTKVSKENTMDSATDFIKSLEWDGKGRLDTWLCDTYGVENNVYHKAVASNWIKGLIKRIIEPGCKFDYVLVLEGAQGSKKSTSLHVLGKDWHVETAMSTENKDFFMQFGGKAIIEFSEGETLSRTEVKRMKAIITMQSDKYRPPYERISKDFPRRCVFAMTTNQSEYLKDETGNRRWLPITVVLPEANVEWLEENREQIFAEAYHRVFKLKERIYEFPKAETLKEQDARRIQDANADVIADWYFTKLTAEARLAGITVHQVYRDGLNGGFASKPLNKGMEMAICDVLKSHLMLTKKREMKHGVQMIRWYNDRDMTGIEIDKTFLEELEEVADNF